MPPSLPTSSSARLHDLDALRAFAMLLGIILHAAIAFVPFPGWLVQDVERPMWNTPEFLHQLGLTLPETFSPMALLLNLIHAFRMQLFFVVSGFFAAMLWKKRGLRALLKHRAKRILLPLVPATILIWPLVALAGLMVAGTKPDSLWVAAKEGRIEVVKAQLEAGVDPNELDPSAGVSALTWSACAGHLEVAEWLIASGAEVERRDRDGGTPLHAAVFFAHPEVVNLLVANGADVQVKNQRGESALDVVEADYGTTKFIGRLIGVPVKEEAAFADSREQIGKRLGKLEGEVESDSTWEIWKMILGVYMAAAMAPVFLHLWFLHYLFWLVLLFAFAAWRYEKSGRKFRPRIAWLIPLAVIPQLFMVLDFGPDTAPGLILWLPKLAYYAVFFGVGALFYGRPDFGEKLKLRWPVLFAVALPVGCIALYFNFLRDVTFEAGFDENQVPVFGFHIIYCIGAVAFAWLMVFGMIGVFRRFFPAEDPRIRYISDASYWLYIAHLPLLFFIQIAMTGWEFPALLKLLIACVATIGILLLAYEWFVRYTFIGTLLNGKKVKPSRTNRV